jgi:hypothetical protein
MGGPERFPGATRAQQEKWSRPGVKIREMTAITSRKMAEPLPFSMAFFATRWLTIDLPMPPHFIP